MFIYEKNIVWGLLFIIIIITLTFTLFKIIKNNSKHYLLSGYINKIERQRDNEKFSEPTIKQDDDFYRVTIEIKI
ncbi:hypothetical protein GOQ27_10290 [Clostridium sp. D2Q-11]|uniref:Uncharacterized protein n=1 Tax=Anaeromonas frigoriresistens TaxID=2683708 RepID=A0A942UWJ6_9FIRM|nr:hypothetical protein [Anaeromonas frigoriresistens]MBS4538855.1 hypothetical protein [Anaeromonas frigoriresistens]